MTTRANSTPFSHTYGYDMLGRISDKPDVGSYAYAEADYTNPHRVYKASAGATL